MQYNELGKTGMHISRVGFGGIPIQRVNQEMVNNIFDKMEELGINFVDTAKLYTTSETQIGIALKGRREKFFLASKSPALKKEEMLEDVQLTLNNLQIDYIDLYQFHNIATVEALEEIMGEGGALEALIELKAQGKVKHIGATSHKVDVIERALDFPIFETIQYPYSVVERQGKELIARAARQGIGSIAMKPMAGGSLRDGRVAIKYLLEDTNLSVAIPGMESVEEVVQNASAADGVPLTLEERRVMEEEGTKLGTRFCRRCQYCMPCPKNINIPMCFLLEGYVTRYNLKSWAEPRYHALAAKADTCIKCGLCEKKCPYDLPIREMLEDVVKTFE